MSTCQACGSTLVDDTCPSCSNRTLSRFIQRELVVLVALVAIAISVFFATAAIATAHRDLQRRDAARWFDLGRSELAQQRPHSAVDMIRRASSLDPDNIEYRLTLASALEEASRKEAARQLLLELRSTAPERPDINIRLARLETERSDDSAAIRYYQNALYGVWGDDAAGDRQRLRVEFIRYLLGRQHTKRALAELIALDGSLADAPPPHDEYGDLFLEAGDARRALLHYRAAIRQEPKNVAALQGAAMAAFQLGDYSATLRYLRTVDDAPEEVRATRTVASLVLTRDPLMPRLSYAERRQRLMLNVSDATARLDTCTANGQLLEPFRAELDALLTRLRRRSIREPLDVIEDGVEAVYRVIKAASGHCGATTELDRAHLLIGRRHLPDPL